ncbi:hypothetical protein OAP25_02275 [Flavobacteriaceae bacterium]|nr:hypothetical protein [Flavobacteriaceae bacterium]
MFVVTTGSTGSSLIVDAVITEKYPWPTQGIGDKAEFNYPSVNIPQPQFKAITVASNYTANDYEFINAKAGSTITLAKYPVENSAIIIRNGDGSVIKLNGNGKNINGSKTGITTQKGTAIEFHYFIDSNEWFAR